MKMNKYIILFFSFFASNIMLGQVLDKDNKISLSLSNGEIVNLIGEADIKNDVFTNKYYYLPSNLRLSTRENGDPEFLFAKYTTEEREDNGGVQGAIMHFLMQWGLSNEMIEEAESLLKQKLRNMQISGNDKYKNMDPVSAKIRGAVDIKSDNGGFKVVSATLSDPVTSGTAPLLPGSKIAIAAKMDKNEAQLMASTFEEGKSITDLSISINYSYEALMPSLEGSITFNWEKFQVNYEKFKSKQKGYSVDKKSGWNFGFWKNVKTSKEKVAIRSDYESAYNYLTETEALVIDVVNFDSENYQQNQETVNMFIDLFMQQIAEVDNSAPATAEQEGMKKTDLSQLQKDGYTSWNVDQTKIETAFKRKVKTYDLKLRRTIKRRGSVTGNLASWYDHAKSNPKCVYSVNLNDPFFQHRDIQCVLDGDAVQMFDEGQINYVTVNIKKDRSAGNPFVDAITFDRESIKNGTVQSITYGRGEDKNSDAYKYEAQWCIRGGEDYPKNPKWQSGE